MCAIDTRSGVRRAVAGLRICATGKPP